MRMSEGSSMESNQTLAEVQEKGGWPHGPSKLELRLGNDLTRVLVALIGIPVVLGLLYLGGWGLTLLVIGISIGAMLEFYWMLEKRGAKPLKTLGIVAGVGFICAASGLCQLESQWSIRVSIFLVITIPIVFILSTLVGGFRLPDKEGLSSVISTIMGFFYMPFLIATLLGTMPVIERIFLQWSIDVHRTLPLPLGSHYVSVFIVMLFAGIWICDSGTYFAGRAFGKHKLFERVSPKKTWEGAIAGAGSAIIGVTLITIWLFPQLRWYDGVIIGAIIGVMGQTGDLVESHLKRACGVKDSSQIIPGHGGVLDRFDSLLFVGPVVFLYLYSRMLFVG